MNSKLTALSGARDNVGNVIVPDTGALIDGRITQMLTVSESKAKPLVLVHNSVVAELEYQANSGKEIGFAGLKELRQLASLAAQDIVSLEFHGSRPSASEIKRARFGEIDSKIRELAREHSGVLITTDKVQAEVATAQGINVQYLEPIITKLEFSLEHFFTPDTMSVHLREGIKPQAKRGKPGQFQLVNIRDSTTTRSELDKIIMQCVEYSKRAPNSFIEIDKGGVTVVQIGMFRVTFTRPPFSDAAELTAVRPIAKLKLENYHLSPNLRGRLAEKAEGILIAGAPGSGKSTLATALAEYYADKSKIVKTVESPRDLQVDERITQYALREGEHGAITDVLLLARPDYTIYDEVRKLHDFETFADLRLAGIGMVGVVHASKAIDAIQRFIGKIDLGMIPQVIDTVVFVDKGAIAKVYSLEFVVKVPSGMREKDLSRPVIEVREFETNRIEYEIYTFGEETVVLPLKQAQPRRELHREQPREHQRENHREHFEHRRNRR